MTLYADPSPSVTKLFTLPEAVKYATEHYPAVRAAMERRNAAQASVSLARDNYLPRADTLWQTNRATRNNVAGVLLPQSTIPNPSGTVLDSSTQSFWGSGAGMQISWEPFDFGYRHATVQSAKATVRRTAEQIELTMLDVQTAAADAALSVLAAEQSVHATQADVDRRTVFARSVHVFVDTHLRPGADASRADAELAAARTQMILAQQNAAIAKAALAELLGLAGTEVDVVPGPLLDSPNKVGVTEVPAANHPLAIVEQDRVLEAKARVDILAHSYAPTFSLQGVGYGRGSGASGNGKPAANSNQGLVPDTSNWAAGITVKFAIFDFASIHSKKKVEQANQRREEQLYAQTVQAVTGQFARAQAALEGAQRIAENTPIQLQASQDAERQARARFQAGVATLVDVAEAQRLLVNAEIDDSLARLSIWRAMERLSAAQGNLQPFIDLVNSANASTSTGGH
ncbi:MAG TPA: TolC family protein [Acidobacteriaceae bacterium]|nr:TolC family protein [Acidobacteriaceae bacterium]